MHGFSTFPKNRSKLGSKWARGAPCCSVLQLFQGPRRRRPWKSCIFMHGGPIRRFRRAFSRVIFGKVEFSCTAPCIANARNGPRATASSHGASLTPRASHGVLLMPRLHRAERLSARAHRTECSSGHGCIVRSPSRGRPASVGMGRPLQMPCKALRALRKHRTECLTRRFRAILHRTECFTRQDIARNASRGRNRRFRNARNASRGRTRQAYIARSAYRGVWRENGKRPGAKSQPGALARGYGNALTA